MGSDERDAADASDGVPAASPDAPPTDAPGPGPALEPRLERRAHAFSRRVPLVAGLVAVGLAALLGLVVTIRNGILVDLDEEWAEEILTIHGPFGDFLALTMNWLGGGVVGVFIIPVLVAVLLLVSRRPWGALYFIVASAASALVVQLLKELFGRARPEDMMVTSDYGSFPSGHVANAATIAVALGVIVPRVAVWIAGACYTVLMAISRTYLGAHWITDTIGGALVGAGVALVVWTVLAKPLERERLAWGERRADAARARAEAHVTPPAKPRGGGDGSTTL
ncbi:phosphatase PAP2 family protein [Agromyces sp. LHK192]|uniref:phosphatase PAP2 family protein n=1 Tax=Agromyces sp. LHK192 TaxID=2498704 RepID=UPI000FDAC2B0|nr:phosphatase PAP2 family protein [Agromyces sp. LHK192]